MSAINTITWQRWPASAFVLCSLVMGCASSSRTSKTVNADPNGHPVSADPTGDAKETFSALAAKLEKIGRDQVVDEAWLRHELVAVLRNDPQHQMARFNLAVLDERDGAWDSARLVYEDLLSRDEHFQPAAENLARYHVEKGDSLGAAETYRKIIAGDRRNVTSRLRMARLLLADGKYEEAIALSKEALGSKPDSMEAHRLLALGYERLGNWSMAEVVVGRGLQLAADDYELNLVLARILLQHREITSAAAKLRELVTKAPKRLEARAQLANIAMAYHDFPLATEQYEAILERVPNHAAATLCLAVCRTQMGRFGDAEVLYQRLEKQSPNDPKTLWNLAVLYHRRLQRFDQAAQYYKRYLDASGGDTSLATTGANEVNRRLLELQADKASNNDQAANQLPVQ